MPDEMRPPMDTQSSLDMVDISASSELNAEAHKYGVTRMGGEPDDGLRERIKNAVRVKRASERAKRGESLIPEPEEEDQGFVDIREIEPLTPNIQLIALRQHLLELEADLEDARRKIAGLEARFIEVQEAFVAKDWNRVSIAVRMAIGGM